MKYYSKVSVLAIVLTLTVLSVPFAEAQRLTEKDVKKYMKAADRELDKGDHAKAGGYLLTVVNEYPDRGDAQLKLARIYCSLGEWNNAVGSFLKAIENLSGPEQAEARDGLIDALLRASRFNEIEPHATVAVEEDPSNLGARTALAVSLAKKGSHDEALREAQSVLQRDPVVSMAHTALGLATLDLGDIHTAKQSFRQALALDTSNGVALLGLAEVLLDEGDYAAAAAEASKALATNRNLARAYAVRGIAAVASGELDAAASELAMAVTLDEHDYEALIAYAQVYEKQGKQVMADLYLDRAIAINPDVAAEAAKATSERRSEAAQEELRKMKLPGAGSKANDCEVAIESFDVRPRADEYDRQ